MTAAPYRSPVDLINDQPLNQVARRLLVRAKRKPDPEFPYYLQLMSAYLHECPEEISRDRRNEILSMVENTMMFDRPRPSGTPA